MNKYFVVPLYRIYLLPLFGFGRIFLLLTTKGRKTGKKRRTPVEYRRKDGIITVFSGRGEDAGWMKNIRLNPDAVSVRHGFHHFKPKIEFISDEQQKIEIIKWYIEKHGKAAKYLFGWDPKVDDIEKNDFSNLVGLISIIQFTKKANKVK